MQQATLTKCPNPVGHFKGIGPHPDKPNTWKGVAANIRCGSWGCPYCKDKNLRRLRWRLFNGEMAQAANVNGFRTRYHIKLLTLTVPGRMYRRRFTPQEAYDHMIVAFEKMMKALQKRLGQFYYFRVVEPQQDGYPHFHVLLVGKAIAPITVLSFIERLWRSKYRLGFIRINCADESIKDYIHAIRYITKYMTKDLRPIASGKRLFTASKGALEKIVKKQNYYMSRINFGVVGPEGIKEVELGELYLPIVKHFAMSKKMHEARKLCRGDDYLKIQGFAADFIFGHNIDWEKLGYNTDSLFVTDQLINHLSEGF